MIIYLLSASQGLYEIREVKLQENKECKYFQNTEVRAATSLLLFDWLVSERKTHWEESRTFEFKKDAGLLINKF
jgi:hypothetical protein